MADINPSHQPDAGSGNTVRALLEAVRGFVCTVDGNLRMEDVAPEWGKLTGQSYAEYCGFGWMDAIHPADLVVAKRDWEEAAKGADSFISTHRVKNRDGKWRHFAQKTVPQLDSSASSAEALIRVPP